MEDIYNKDKYLTKLDIYTNEIRTIEEHLEEQIYCDLLNLVSRLKEEVENKSFSNIYCWANEFLKIIKE